MSDSFSKRYGYGPCSKELIFEGVTPKLRIGICNLIQDYVNDGSLPSYDDLYSELTTFFRLKRKTLSLSQKESAVENLITEGLHWNEIYDLIEYLFTSVRYYDYDEFEQEWIVIPAKVATARYQYTIAINKLLSAENIGLKLKKGKLERIGSEFLDKETVEKLRKILAHPDFMGPNRQFNKAIEFYSKRPKPDLENCVKEAVLKFLFFLTGIRRARIRRASQ